MTTLGLPFHDPAFSVTVPSRRSSGAVAVGVHVGIRQPVVVQRNVVARCISRARADVIHVGLAPDHLPLVIDIRIIVVRQVIRLRLDLQCGRRDRDRRIGQHGGQTVELHIASRLRVVVGQLLARIGRFVCGPGRCCQTCKLICPLHCRPTRCHRHKPVLRLTRIVGSSTTGYCRARSVHHAPERSHADRVGVGLIDLSITYSPPVLIDGRACSYAMIGSKTSTICPCASRTSSD